MSSLLAGDWQSRQLRKQIRELVTQLQNTIDDDKKKVLKYILKRTLIRLRCVFLTVQPVAQRR